MAFERVANNEKDITAISASYLRDETILVDNLIRLAAVSDNEKKAINYRAYRYVTVIRASDDKMSLLEAHEQRICLKRSFLYITPLSTEFATRLFVQDRRKLPEPTGETNALPLFPKGALCRILSNNLKQASFLKQTQDAFKIAEAPAGLFRTVDHSEIVLFFNLDIEGVVSDYFVVAGNICRRSSTIIPLLTSLDEPERLYHDRTLTANTTAVDGNAPLLAMTA